MSSVGQLKSLNEKYGSDVQFYFVYCREAHAIDSDRPTTIAEVEQPLSTEERRSVAQQFLKDVELDIPALLDDINDTVGQAYASHPDRIYLVDKNGNIAFAGDRGPRGFKPALLEEAIIKEMGKNKSESVPSSGGGKAGNANRRGPAGGLDPVAWMNRLPVMQVLDADSNGSLSASEIQDAVEALKSLDKNGDGTLTPDETMPRRRQR